MGGGASVKKEDEVNLITSHSNQHPQRQPSLRRSSSIKLNNLVIPSQTSQRRRRRLSTEGKNLLLESLSPSPTSLKRRQSSSVEPPPSPLPRSKKKSMTAKPPPSPAPSNVKKRFGRVESPPRNRRRKSGFGEQLRQNLAKRFRDNMTPRTSDATWGKLNVGDFVDVRVKKGDNVHRDNDVWDLAEIVSVNGSTLTVQTERSDKTMWLDAEIDTANVAVAFSKSAIQEKDEEDIDPFAHAMASMGLRVRRVSSDGNCLFRSIAFCVWGDEEHHTYLRRLVCEHMLAHRSHFGLYTDGSFDRWLEDMRQNGCWGGELCIQAAEEILDRPIKVFSSENPSQPMNLIHNNVALAFHLTHVKPICLSYHGRSHYNALVSLDILDENLKCLEPRESTNILDGRLRGWRTPKLKRKKRRVSSTSNAVVMMPKKW